MVDYAKVVKDGMKKKKPWQAIEGKPDPGFLRDMGYGNPRTKGKKRKIPEKKSGVY